MRFAAAIVCLAMSGCAGMQPSNLSAEATEPLICENADQCSLYWKRAQLWVAKNSRWKIQSATDVVITTYTPVRSSAEFGFQITREPLDVGPKERIAMQPICVNMFGCGDLNATVVSFKRYVRGLQ